MAFQFSSTAFRFPRNPRNSIYGGKYTKDHYSSFVFPATRSPSFVISTTMSTSPQHGPPCVFSPLRGVFLVVVINPLHCHRRSPCCITLQSDWIVLQVPLPLMHIVFAITMPSELSSCPSCDVLCCCLFDPACLAPRPCAAINRHCPWAAWIDPLPLPSTITANDLALLPIPSPSSHAIVSHP